MRVTDATTERNFLYNIAKAEERMQKLQDQESSMMNFQKPEDDPVGVQRSLLLKNQITRNSMYLRNIDRAKSWLETTEGALAGVSNVLIRAQELDIGGVTGSTPQDARDAVAKEVQGLIDEVSMIADTQVEGRHILTGTMPTWRVGPGIEISSDDLTAVLNDVTARLTDLKNILTTPGSGDPSTVLTQIQQSEDTVLSQRATNGARVARIEALETRTGDLDVEYQKLLSNVEDIDITQVVVRLKSAEVAYQAALGAGAMLIQPTLLDYLK